LLDRQQAAMARERRLANEVAHELRTPLSSIALQASALGGELAPEAQAQALDRIRQDALRAGHVLNQLLALARASRAELDGATASVDLAALARNACAEYAQAAWQRGDELEVSAPDALLVRGHPVLLDLLLRNLIENALKHTPARTRIAVQMGEGGGEHGAWLQVCDDGARVVAVGDVVAAAPVAVDSLHLGHEIVARVAQVHRARFGKAPAPAPFTTCYRLDFARESLLTAG
jgi:two-component system sensor histidine kinase QseC